MRFARFSSDSRLFAALKAWCGGVALLFALCAGGPALATAPLLTADSISYNDVTGVVTATGNVELSQGAHVLRADKIAYDKKTDVARAEGNVAIVSQDSGEVLYAGALEMTSDMKNGFLDQAGLLFPDGTRIAAASARKYAGRYLVAVRGVYSACHLCKTDPRAPPLWQIKAERVTHDAMAKDVIYRDATIEFWGIPAFYTPYFAHPDPSVKRRNGFLTPSAGVDSTIGAMARLPYYIDLARNSDLVVTPTFSEEDLLQLNTAWRHRFRKGKMSWEGSVARADYTDDTGTFRGKQWRGHVFGKTLFALSDEWRAGTDVAYASDKGYLNRYKISGDDLLVNRAYAEYFSGRNYAVGDFYYFQDMRPGTRQIEPLVAPDIRFSALGEPGKTWGGRWSFNGSLLVTSREKETDLIKQGPSTRRLALSAGWQRQMVSQTGFLTTVSGSARADTYWADNVPDPNATGPGAGFSDVRRVRPFAQADVTVRYPLSRHGEGYAQILEPVAVLSLAPRVRNNVVLPNEDSLDVEFDETSLFAPNRFSGIDRIEGGTRAAYGLRHAVFGKNGGRIEMLAGQVFRFRRDDSFTEGSGLRDSFSDYVGRVDFAPTDWINVNYGFRLDQSDFSVTRQVLQATAGTASFRPFVNYTSLKQSEGSTTVDQKIEEISGGFTARFARFWSLSAAHTRAIAPTPGPRAVSAALTYQDECFKTDLSFRRDYTNQIDVEKGFSVFFNIALKNFGDRPD